jgi:hypothetical protein
MRKMQDVETMCLKTKSLDEKPGQRGNFLQGAMYRHHMLASQNPDLLTQGSCLTARNLENHVISLTQKVFMITGNSQHQDIGT